MKKYLLFDLDGTLTDPKVGICTCVQYALASFGIQEPDLDKLEPFIGPPLKESFMEFYQMDPETADAAVEKYRERFRDTGIFENKLYDGVPEMLKTLCGKGLFLAVASSKPTVFVERILEHFNIARYFKVVVGSELDGTRVNKDEVVEEALKRLFEDKPVQKDQVYMIGDRKFDVEGARALGVESVGVTYGYGRLEELKAARADYIVRSVEELQKFLLRGTEEQQKTTGFQKVWMLAYPFLMFMLVRLVTLSLLQYLLVYLANASGGNIPFLFAYDQEGQLIATGNATALMAAAGYIAGAAFIWSIARKTIRRMTEDRKLLHIKGEPVQSYVLTAAATVGAVIGLNMLMELLGLTARAADYQAVAESQYAAHFLLGLVVYGLVTPIAEEILFRGILYPCLGKMMKPMPALLMAALFFGMYHGNSIQGIYGFAMGMLILYALEYFGDFRAAVAVHMGANLLAYILTKTGLAAGGIVCWPVCLAGLALAAGSIFLLHRQKKIF
ncbi:MAG: HAD hydrolase-like protein [Acetatifactor sp.]|nr:HAD hydrolase-like protein [Acetatifactor sp.]